MTQTAVNLYGSSVSMNELTEETTIRKPAPYLYVNKQSRLRGISLRTDTGLQEAKPENHTVRTLHLTKKQDKFIALQKWAGYVIEIGEEVFTARLTDLKNKGIEEDAEIYLTEVSEEDRPLLLPGAVFYWSIGYRDDYNGQRHNEGFIRFRRLPAFSRKDIDRAQQEAEKIREAFGWDKP